MTRQAMTFRAIAAAPSVRAGHRRHRTRLWPYVVSGGAPTVLAAPVVYSMIVPFALLDLWVTAYQAVCFRAWGVRRVRRNEFMILDRHRLEYLNGLEKLNCAFCGYANGVIGYVREVTSRTEQYWCPIRHSRRPYQPHRRYESFAPYGDPVAYRRRLPSLRSALTK